MKTDVEIKQDMYACIVSCGLNAEISGSVGYTGRETDKEDCIISVLDSDAEQVQTAIVYVNVYVPDITSGGRKQEDVSRTEVLSKLFSEKLQSGFGETFRFSLRKQRIEAVQGRDEHVITHRIEYLQLNS